MRGVRTFGVLVSLGLGCWGKSGDTGLGGETNWFGWCESDTDCSSGSCVCGICTIECGPEAWSCTGAPAGSECVLPIEGGIPGTCEGEVPAGACLLPCSEDGECSAGLECVAGWCLASSASMAGGELDLSSYLCADNPVLTLPGGTLTVRTPDELEALRGCRQVEGSLRVDTYDIPSLEPLSELRVVTGPLWIGPELDESRADASWRSLAGLENLERVEFGSLGLSHFDDADLAALASLIQAGSLSLSEFPNLTSLAALAGAQIDFYLSLYRLPELRDVAGPSFSALSSLALMEVPLLESVAPLSASLSELDDLSLTQTGLANVDDFSGVSKVSILGVSNNPRLTQLDGFRSLRNVTEAIVSGNPVLASIAGLSGLEQLVTLNVNSNDALVELPEFPLLARVDSINITGNPRLRSGPRFPTLQSGTLWVAGNDQLETLDGFTSLDRAFGLIQIVSNPSLREIDMRALRRVERMQIANNPSLVRLDLSALQTVTDLGVYDNESLTPGGTSLEEGTARRFGIPIESAP